MKRTLISETTNCVGQTVTVSGWANVVRAHGKILFIDLRDRSGLLQVVFLPQEASVYEKVKNVRSEWVISITGQIVARPEKMVNAKISTGGVELVAKDLEVLSEAQTIPFDIGTAGYEINEEVRLKYRYLDLRRDRLQKNIKARDSVISFFRDYMHKNDFVEIETPMLMKGTPEGSREYIVPSRLDKGKFYVLPQSPQQFKQLTMVAGFERYFQIARCMRDEDLRGDRQPEFTQLDFEMSFVTQEDILEYTEAMFIKLVEILYPEKKFTEIPFPRLTYAESMKQYGNDKPDIRKDKNNPNELGFVWVLDFPMFEKDDEGNIQAVHHPFCSINTDDKDKFMKGEDILSIRAQSYDIVLNGYELSSGSIRIHERMVQQKVFELLKISEEDQKRRFGHMLEAFTYGAPPHGGFAPGIDRIVMILQNEPNIREVIAFPKTGEGRDLMMGSPDIISSKQLKELGIEVVKGENKLVKEKKKITKKK